MNQKILVVFALIIGVTVLFYFQMQSERAAEDFSEKKKSMEKEQVAVKADDQKLSQDLNLSSSKQAEAVLSKLKFTPEQAMMKFSNARNEWLADPNMPPEAKEKMIAELAYALWGEDAVIPEQTEDDLEQQARIREEVLSFQSDLEMIKADKSMTLEEKKQALSSSVNKFVQQGK
jgi:hypothetical protein